MMTYLLLDLGVVLSGTGQQECGTGPHALRRVPKQLHGWHQTLEHMQICNQYEIQESQKSTKLSKHTVGTIDLLTDKLQLLENATKIIFGQIGRVQRQTELLHILDVIPSRENG
jgi:hypothetical protein